MNSTLDKEGLDRGWRGDKERQGEGQERDHCGFLFPTIFDEIEQLLNSHFNINKYYQSRPCIKVWKRRKKRGGSKEGEN